MTEAEKTREECAKLVEAMLDQAPWTEYPWARAALGTAVRAIRRGRHLSEREKLLNLAAAMDDPKGADNVAAWFRAAANSGLQ